MALLHDERFVDRPPAEVYATFLDEGKYVCSLRTMYRILHEDAQDPGNDAGSCGIRGTRLRSCWPHNRTSSGRGTSVIELDNSHAVVTSHIARQDTSCDMFRYG